MKPQSIESNTNNLMTLIISYFPFVETLSLFLMGPIILFYPLIVGMVMQKNAGHYAVDVFTLIAYSLLNLFLFPVLLPASIIMGTIILFTLGPLTIFIKLFSIVANMLASYLGDGHVILESKPYEGPIKSRRERCARIDDDSLRQKISRSTISDRQNFNINSSVVEKSCGGKSNYNHYHDIGNLHFSDSEASDNHNYNSESN